MAGRSVVGRLLPVYRRVRMDTTVCNLSHGQGRHLPDKSDPPKTYRIDRPPKTLQPMKGLNAGALPRFSVAKAGFRPNRAAAARYRRALADTPDVTESVEMGGEKGFEFGEYLEAVFLAAKGFICERPFHVSEGRDIRRFQRLSHDAAL